MIPHFYHNSQRHSRYQARHRIYIRGRHRDLSGEVVLVLQRGDGGQTRKVRLKRTYEDS